MHLKWVSFSRPHLTIFYSFFHADLQFCYRLLLLLFSFFITSRRHWCQNECNYSQNAESVPRIHFNALEFNNQIIQKIEGLKAVFDIWSQYADLLIQSCSVITRVTQGTFLFSVTLINFVVTKVTKCRSIKSLTWPTTVVIPESRYISW